MEVSEEVLLKTAPYMVTFHFLWIMVVMVEEAVKIMDGEEV